MSSWPLGCSCETPAGVARTFSGVHRALRRLDAAACVSPGLALLFVGEFLVHIENILLAVNAEFGVNIAQVGTCGSRSDAQRLSNALGRASAYKQLQDFLLASREVVLHGDEMAGVGELVEGV